MINLNDWSSRDTNEVNIIDFEASSLAHNSYPIQVGVVMHDGSEYMAYIKPTPETWTDWNPQSQDIHNIPRQLLIDIGKEPEVVAAELNEFIGDKSVACDGHLYDQMWATTLYDATSIERTWSLDSISKYGVLMHPGVSWSRYKEFYASDDYLSLTEHDALDDAKLIRHLIKLGRNDQLEYPTR
jgi:thiamine pyrophosphate-dependent acetolactate synthase large subunit-like protein